MGSKSKKRSKDLMKKMLNEEAYGSQGPVSEQEFLHKRVMHAINSDSVKTKKRFATYLKNVLSLKNGVERRRFSAPLGLSPPLT